MFTTSSQLINEWIQKLYAEGISEKTIKWYIYNLKHFNKFTDKPLEEITEDDLRRFFIWMQKDSDFSSATILGCYRTLKALFNNLYNSRKISNNPFNYIKKPKTERKIIYSFNKIEINEILNHFDKRTFLGYRNFAILATLFSTGIRKSELLEMKASDFIYEGVGYFRILGKGRKERVIPVGVTLDKIIKNYIKRRRKYINEINTVEPLSLWINQTGEPLTASGIDHIFKELKKSKLKWSTRVSAHTIRHTYALMFLQNGGDPFTLQRLMGHSDISTTRLYVELNTDYLKKQSDNYNPLDNHNWQYL